VPLVGGLCHAADFDQMWPEMCLSLEDFVSQQNLTKCGPNTCLLTGDIVLLWGLTTYGSQGTHHQKRPVPSKWILIVDQCRHKTAVSDYNAM
jgi:hypothetical protein